MCLWPPVATESPGIWIKVCRILRLSHSPPPPAHALSRHHWPHHILLPHTATTHHTVSRDTAHTTSFYTPPHTTTNNSNILPFLFLSLPFPLWYHLVEGLTTPSYGLGTFCPLDTFPVWTLSVRGHRVRRGRRGEGGTGVRADEGNCWSFTEC